MDPEIPGGGLQPQKFFATSIKINPKTKLGVKLPAPGSALGSAPAWPAINCQEQALASNNSS